jgi:hypothetical protein
MKKISLLLLAITAVFLTSCSSENTNETATLKTEKEEEHPLNPKVISKHGELGIYKTLDEYYTNDSGSKTYHGYRKNLYPTLRPRMISYYQHGTLIWTESYDEVGNVLSSNR